MQEWSLGGVNWPVAEAWWQTDWAGKPARMQIVTPKLSAAIDVGEEVRMEDEHGCAFLGYVFSVEESAEKRRIVAYDQLRYLMFKDTYLIEAKTADEILALLAKDVGLQVGELASTGVAMDLAMVDKKLMDIVERALELTRQRSGRNFFLWDDAGKLRMSEEGSVSTQLLLTEQSAVTEYARGESIDRDSYNRVKLARKDRARGERNVVVQEDARSADSWGRLQYYERVDEKMSEGEMKAQAAALLREKNRSVRTLTLECLGDSRCRAGKEVGWRLDGKTEAGSIVHALHHWKGPKYVMTLDVKCSR